MDGPTNIVRLRQPDEIDDPPTEVRRAGARRMLAQVVELEAEAFLIAMQDLRPRSAGSIMDTARSARSRPASARCR